MSRLFLVVLALAFSTLAQAQRSPQIDVGIGASPVDGRTSPAASATVTAWPTTRVGFALHGEYAQQPTFLEVTSRSAAAFGILAALAVPLSEGEITLAAGPSLSREDVRFENAEAGRGWTPGALARVQIAFPVGQSVGLMLSAGGNASAEGLRPSSTFGLSARLGG